MVDVTIGSKYFIITEMRKLRQQYQISWYLWDVSDHFLEQENEKINDRRKRF